MKELMSWQILQWMQMAIKKPLLILLFLSASINIAFGKCHIEKSIVSLSGPMTHFLEELDLVRDENLKAISKFHPLKKEFKGEVLAGGLFLSPQVFHKYKDALIVFDKSREFKYLLEKSNHMNFLEIDSRDQDPFEVINLLEVKALGFLKGCRSKLSDTSKKFKSLKEKLLTKNIEIKANFFLGSLSGKLPETIIANDGPVIFLRKFSGFSTYPSELAYVNWSMREFKRQKGFVNIGLNEAKTEEFKVKEVKPNYFDISYRGVLTPGIRQAYFLGELFKLSLFSSK